jgi:hypothetical protein
LVSSRRRICWHDSPVADRALRQRQLPGNRRLPHAAVGDDRERRDEAVVRLQCGHDIAEREPPRHVPDAHRDELRPARHPPQLAAGMVGCRQLVENVSRNQFQHLGEYGI